MECDSSIAPLGLVLGSAREGVMQRDDLNEGGRVFRVEGDGDRRDMVRRGSQIGDSRALPGAISVFLIVSKFETDHALTYVFFEGVPSVAVVQAFVDSRPDRFRGINVVIELAERYASPAQAKHRALGLRSWLVNINIVYPPVRIF